MQCIFIIHTNAPHTWNKLEILQDILQFKIIWMEGHEHFDGRTGLLSKGRYTFLEGKDHLWLNWKGSIYILILWETITTIKTGQAHFIGRAMLFFNGRAGLFFNGRAGLFLWKCRTIFTEGQTGPKFDLAIQKLPIPGVWMIYL